MVVALQLPAGNKQVTDAVVGSKEFPAVSDLLVVRNGFRGVVVLLGDPAQVIVGLIHSLIQGQHLTQVGAGRYVIADFAIDQRKGEQQVAVPG